jgi:phage replication-related protein YjqB (UPF0714/DUF867 family)
MAALPSIRSRDRYRNFAALAASEAHGRDYRIRVVKRPASEIAIVAPHGGSIERRTSPIAESIAGAEHNLYLFEGLDPAGSFEQLHITSHRFDEPRCLELISRCNIVIAVHGCSGSERAVYLGGRDSPLIVTLAAAFARFDLRVRHRNHAYPGTHRRNICNRGASGRGVQLEFSDGLRGHEQERHVVGALGRVLAERTAGSPSE